MKNYLKNIHPNLCLLLFACTIVLASSCKKNERAIDDPVVTKTENEKIISYLSKKGFDKNQIVFESDRVIVETDIIFTIEQLKERVENDQSSDPDKPQTEHWRSNYLVSNAYNTNIKLWIEPGVPDSWVAAVAGAVNNWNAMNGTKLGLSIVSTQAAANTRVFMGFENSNWIARAYLPGSNSAPGVSVEINSNYNSLAASSKLFAITHELGHTVGFYHTNQNTGIFITGTPTVDANSVMNSFVLPWNGFTAGDILATGILYPL